MGRNSVRRYVYTSVFPLQVGPQAPQIGPQTPLAGPQTPLAGPHTPLAGPAGPQTSPACPQTPMADPYTSPAVPQTPSAGPQTLFYGGTDGWMDGCTKPPTILQDFIPYQGRCHLRIHNIKEAG